MSCYRSLEKKKTDFWDGKVSDNGLGWHLNVSFKSSEAVDPKRQRREENGTAEGQHQVGTCTCRRHYQTQELTSPTWAKHVGSWKPARRILETTSILVR